MQVLINCAKMGFNSMFFEGDCLVVVHWSNSQLELPSNIRPVIMDIRKLLQLHLDWSINFILREANNVAHLLAKLACSVSFDFIWIEECLGHVMRCIVRSPF